MFVNMKSEDHLNKIIFNYYSKTYGSPKQVSEKTYFKRSEEIDVEGLRKIHRNNKSLPPAIKKALNYLYPEKLKNESTPASEYDSFIRKLSDYPLNNQTVNLKPKKKVRLKKLSMSDIYETRTLASLASNSQEYINCIGYNGQVESEYLKTKDGINEYKNLYQLIMKDSGLCLDKIKPRRRARRRDLS